MVATRAAERRDGPVAAAHHSFVKVAAEARYSGLRAQMTDRTEAANVVLRRQRPSAASGPELFQLYEEEPCGGPPAPLHDDVLWSRSSRASCWCRFSMFLLPRPCRRLCKTESYTDLWSRP